MVKNTPTNAEDVRDVGLIPGREDPWRGAWQSTPVFVPGESPWTEGPGGLQSMGLQSRSELSTSTLTLKRDMGASWGAACFAILSWCWPTM